MVHLRTTRQHQIGSLQSRRAKTIMPEVFPTTRTRTWADVGGTGELNTHAREGRENPSTFYLTAQLILLYEEKRIDLVIYCRVNLMRLKNRLRPCSPFFRSV